MFEKVWTFLVDRFSGRNAKNFEVRDRIMTRANMMTMLGIGLTTLYLSQYYYGFWLVFIPVICPLIVGTDGCDGFLADYYNEHSKWGKILDPFRDKYFTFVALGNIWIIGGNTVLVPIVVIVSLELMIALESLVMSLNGETLEVHWIGKARSAIQWVAGYAILVQYYWIGHAFLSPFFLTCIMAGASAVAYCYYSIIFIDRDLGK
jgi:phosphatidylglycerophosphate synthase